MHWGPLRAMVRWRGRRFVRVKNLVFAGLAVVLGVVVEEITPLDQDTKNLLAGALLAGGVGVAFAELTTTSDRRKVEELRREGFARCRAAYRLGEFALPWAEAVSHGESSGHNIEGMLDISDIAGVRRSVESIARDAAGSEPPDLRDDLGIQLQFAGDDLVAFFRLGSQIGAIHGAGGMIDDRASLHTLLQQATDLLAAVAPYTGEDELLNGWLRLRAWWEAQRVSDVDAHTLVTLFHLYFLVLGARGNVTPGPEAQRFRARIATLARTRLGASDRELASVMADVRAAVPSQ